MHSSRRSTSTPWRRLCQALVLALPLLAAAPAFAQVAVSGTVKDDSGANWALLARVTFSSGGIVYTNPATGAYGPVSIPANTPVTITVEPLIDGYVDATRVVNLPGPTATENFDIDVDAATCSAPGYAATETPVLSEAFTGGIPGTWTVVNNTFACPDGEEAWSTTDLLGTVCDGPGASTPGTGGVAPCALINSDQCGSTADLDTDLVTPNINTTTYTSTDSLKLSFNSDYRDLCEVGNAVTLDVWNGSAWITLMDFCNVDDRRGPRVESFGTTAANGITDAKFRWHYVSDWDWWWAIDNVSITKASCAFQGQGLVWGFVTDANTNEAVDSTVTIDAPADSIQTLSGIDPLVDGYYALAGTPGVRTVTATAPLYGSVSGMATAVSGALVRLDLALTSGLLVFTPDPIVARVPLFTTATINGQVENEGSVTASFNLFEINTPVPAAPLGPIQTLVSRVPENKKEMVFAVSTRDYPVREEAQSFPGVVVGAGEVSAGFAAGLPGGPYGNAVRQSSEPDSNVEVWLGNLAALAGDDENFEFNSDGVSFLTATGSSVVPVEASVFWADMTYNQRTNSFWQVNVGGDNCIHEFNEADGFTGNMICPDFATTQRGLAYDPVTDTYYSGTFVDGSITQFNPAGDILRQVAAAVDTVGMAFNPMTGHLFAMQNTASPAADIVVMDVNTPTFDFINVFDLVQDGNPVMGDFEQAGLDMDCQGRLWADNFVTGDVFVADTGEGSSCTDIPWLTVSPTSGTLAPDAIAPITLTFDANLASPGFHEAHLQMDTDTPTGTEFIPVLFTAAFLDVPAGNPFDRFIHAIAGVGVTAGCGSGNFCPNDPVTRAQMAVWLLRGKFGPDYNPPHATGLIFADVSSESFGADYIEELYDMGVTAGCATSPLRYCPNDAVTRAAMAVFLLLTFEGPGYTPPPATGVFNDVPVSSPFAPWVEELAARGVTAGCGNGNYCPNTPLTRAEMATFMTLVFDFNTAPAP